jgi:hypothetical protein
MLLEDLKTFEILAKLSINGYSEDNADDELYLHDVLRKTNDIHLYGMICAALGHAGGLFSVPTLIAHSMESDQKAELAKLALDVLKDRLKTDKKDGIKDFFTPSYWKPVWVAPKEKFITYVACLRGFASDDKPLSSESMDDLGERLIQEIQIDLTPYQSFRELRLSSNWHLEEDMQQVMVEINDDTTITDALRDIAITKDPNSQFEENLIYAM